MTGFAANLLLAIAWCALGGELSASSLALGWLIGFAALLIASPVAGGVRYHRAVLRVLAFAPGYIVDLVRSAVRVAHDVVTPRSHMQPAIIEHTLAARTDAEIAAVANLVSLTPGTLALDVTPDRHTLIVHVMFAGDDPAKIRELEGRVLRLMRGPES